jgi:predicted aldo/keto reductase-like oxidoreductase
MCEETVPVMLCLMGDEETLKDATQKYSEIESATESEKKLVRKVFKKLQNKKVSS